MGRKRKQQPLESSVQEATSGTRKSSRKRKLPVATEEGEQSEQESDNQDSHNLSDKTEESVEELVTLNTCC